MADPGLTFGATVVTGLIGENAWGDWQIDQQESHAFGVTGMSSIQGALVNRDVDVPIMVWGYTSQVQRDTAVLGWEKLAGSVGLLQIRVAGGVVIFNQTGNVKLMKVSRGKSGFDGIHLHWRSLVFTFRLLSPNGLSTTAG